MCVLIAHVYSIIDGGTDLLIANGLPGERGWPVHLQG